MGLKYEPASQNGARLVDELEAGGVAEVALPLLEDVSALGR